MSYLGALGSGWLGLILSGCSGFRLYGADFLQDVFGALSYLGSLKFG